MRTPSIVIILLLTCSFAQAAQPPATAPATQPGGIEVKGEFSLPAPAAELPWQEMQQAENKGTKMILYGAFKPGTAGRVVLIFEDRTADTEAKKVASLKGAYNGLVQGMKGQKYSDIQGKPPSVTPPIPKKVTYTFTCKDSEGNPLFVEGAIVFGKNIYQFQIVADSKEKLEQLAKVIDALKE